MNKAGIPVQSLIPLVALFAVLLPAVAAAPATTAQEPKSDTCSAKESIAAILRSASDKESPPAELLLTNPASHKLGRDPDAGVVFNEIPQGRYDTTRGKGPPPPGNPWPSARLEICGPEPGSYHLDVIGTESGDYELAIVTADREGDRTDWRFTLRAKKNMVEQFTIHYSSDPAEASSVVRDRTPRKGS